ncbi:hypothetical protein FIBSPDRAFT_990221 [Athelia psychrophila]|uniref:Uncharacterized protein n=1 Tax=Athelia psychrophila TaxID=1759441 RepID=A0A166WM77_9AGAM|nr:hypothetical protein FIBSPDRAFT_990221 [Fibularhizoctonia sp. CBS 109695]
MLRHWSLQALLLGSKRVNGQFQRYPSLARLYAQRQAQAIQTLDPSKIQSSDYVDLAGTEATISTLNSTFRLHYRRPDSSAIYTPFPENSSGFLYLSSTADKAQSAWEVRFRVTDSNSPPSFKSGADLLRPDHKPWHIPVRLLGSKKYAALWELLLQGGLVDDALPSKLKQAIQTLNPSRLQSSDHLNLSGSARILIPTQESPFCVAYTSLKRRHVPFPDDARGFLYLHSPAAEPKAMWEIRFRVTDNNCPSSLSGSDLLFPNLTPWAISLGSLQARHPEYLPLRDLLIREGLDIDALLEKMGATRPKKSTSSPLIDYSLTQRFRVDFDRTIIIVNFISFGGEQLRCAIQHVFDADEPRLKPYSGSAWCRFEAHSSPGSTQPDQLAIRILEMIVPVTVSKPDIAHRVPMPQEGQLIMSYTKRGPGNHQPLTLDPRRYTLNAETTAHPVIQSILRDAAT